MSNSGAIVRTLVSVLVLIGSCLALLTGCGGSGSGGDTGSSTVFVPSYIYADFPPRANGAWLYDASNDSANNVVQESPGYWSSDINSYNGTASAAHTITMLYSYGGSLGMSCSSALSCSTSDYSLSFNPTGGINSGYQSAQAYATSVSAPAGQKVYVAPILDGVIGSASLKYFNALDRMQASDFADKVAQTVCSDDDVAGIEFDLERFDVSSKNGQYYFYLQIAKDFSGNHNGNANDDPYGCVDADHPDGRFFSVFTSYYAAAPGTAQSINLQKILATYSNGFAIAALYDLSSKPAGTLLSVSDYLTKVSTQVNDMKKWSDRLGIDYAFAIPGGASAHEYTTCTGLACVADAYGVIGFPMLDYTKNALSAINQSGAQQDPLFIGNDIWFWGPLIHISGSYIGPSKPPAAVLNYLSTEL